MAMCSIISVHPKLLLHLFYAYTFPVGYETHETLTDVAHGVVGVQ